MEDKISSYIDRSGIQGDTDFMLKLLNSLYDNFKRISDLKIELNGSKTFRETATAAAKLNSEFETTKANQDKLNQTIAENIKSNAARVQSEKAVKSVIDQRFATEAKLVTVQTDYNKATVANRLELQKQNKELKNAIELRDAESGSIEKARARIKVLTDERNKLNLFTQAGKDRLIELNAAIDKNGEFIKKNGDKYLQQKLNIGNYVGSAKIVVDALSAVEKKIESLKQKQSGLQNISAANPVGFKLGNQAAELNQVTAELRQAEKEFTALNGITQDPKFLNIASKVGDAKVQVRGFTTTLIELERQGLGDTNFAKEIRKDLAGLTDQIGDTRAEIKALSSDTRGFDLFAGSINAAADVFQTAAGAAVLFGASEEDAAAATKNLVAIQSISNGVKGIANELTTKGTAANKAYAFLQGLVAVATDRTATAQARMNAVLKLSTIGLIVGAVALLITKYDDWFGTTKKLTAQQQLMADLNSKLADSYVDEKRSLDEIVSKLKNENTTRAEKAKLVKELQETYPNYLGNIRLEKGEVVGLAEGYNKLIKAIELKSRAQAAGDLLAEQEKELLKKGLEVGITSFEQADKLAESYKDSENIGVRTVLKIYNGVKATRDQLKGLKAEAELGLQKLGGDPKPSPNPTPKAPKKSGEKDRAEEERKAAFEIRQRALQDEIDGQKKIADEVSDRSYVARKAQFDAERKQIAEARDFELVSEKTTAAQIAEIRKGNYEGLSKVQLNIIDEANKKERDAQASLGADLLNIQQEIDKKIIGSREAMAEESAAQDAKVIEGLTESLEAQNARARRTADERLKNLSDEYLAGKISKEKYESDKQDIENQFLKTSLLNQIAYYKKLVQLSVNDEKAKEAALAKIAELEKQLGDVEVNIKIKATADGDSDIIKDAKAQIKEKLIQLGEELKSTFFSIIDDGLERQKNALTEQIDLIQQRKEKELQANDQVLQSAQDKAANALLIESRAAAQSQAIERQKKAIDIQRAKFEKAKALTEVIQQTAIGVISAQKYPPPFNIILSAIIAGIGAVQAARIISEPLPAYKFGKSASDPYEGYAHVDDGGKPEAILRNDGTIEIGSNKPRITYIKRGETVLPDAKQLTDMQLRMAVDATGNLVKGYNHQPTDTTSAKLIVNGLKEVKKEMVYAIQNQPQPVIQATDKVKKWVRSSGSISDLSRY